MSNHSTPQDAADRLLAATQSTQRDRAFLTWFAVVFIVVVFAGATASYVLNPYGHFAPTMFAPRVTLDRDQKLTLWRALPASAEVVVIGSSHVKKLDPVCLTKLTGRRAFNFGVDGGSLDDIRAAFHIVLEARPAQIVLGIDPTLFASTSMVSRPSLWANEFSKYVDAGIEDHVDVLGEMLWSQSALLDDWAVLRRGRSHVRSHSFRADGFWETPKQDAELASGAYDLAKHVRSSADRLVPIYRAANVDPARVALLHATLANAKRAGVEVIAFLSPLHPSLTARLALDSSFVTTMVDLEQNLRNLDTAGLLRFVPAPLSSYGSPADFVDADHVSARNAARLAEHLYGRRGECAVQ